MMTDNPDPRADFDKFLRRQKLLRRLTWVMTILPLAVFLAFIYLTAREQVKLQNLRQQSLDLNNLISDNEKKLEKMKQDVNYYASQLSPSVDIFIAREDQRSKANDAAERIRKLNYNARVQEEPDPKIKNTYVRYFFKDDKQFADEIQKQIRSLGINAEPQDFGDDQDRGALGYTRPKTLELWLGRKFIPLASPQISR